MKSSHPFIRALSGLILLSGLLPAASMAGWDDFRGDSVIYTAGGGARKPNILFVIDRSSATLNRAAGIAYVPTNEYTAGGRNPWDIYVSDNKGDFDTVVVANGSDELANLDCSGYPGAQVKEFLVQNGTYSGSGSVDSPVIKANRNQCETASSGASYALGNYLNYLDTPPPNTKVAGADGRDYFLVTSHNSSSVPQPGSGSESSWSSYWVDAGTVEQGETWVSGHDYTVSYGVAKTQKEIMFSALQAVISSKFNVANFGLATYGPNNKGALIFEEMRSLSLSDVSNASEVPLFFKKIPGSGDAAALATYTAGPQRSQAEAIYDAGYYLAGGAAGTPYPSISTTAKIDAGIKNDCGNTHIIFLTNGLSNGDADPKLGNILNADGSIDYSTSTNPEISVLGADTTTEGSYGAGTHHLDDAAWYLYHEHQITTNIVLAFQSWDAMVARAAHNGGGMFANVYNEEEMRRALEKMIVPIVQEVDTAFVAPVVPANPENRTFSGSRLYLGFFYPKQDEPWYGNLKKLGISDNGTVVDRYGHPATCPDYDAGGNLLAVCSGLDSGVFKPTAISYWNPCTDGDASCGDGSTVEGGGVGEVLYDTPIVERKIYTYLGDGSLAQKSLTHANNLFSKQTIVYGGMGATGTNAEKDQVIDFMYGKDVWDFDEDGDVTEKRNWIFGDILHSKPLVVGYNHFEYEHEGVCPADAAAWSNESGGTFADINKSVIYVGSNDGMLHAFRDCDGKELWSFIPQDLLPKLHLLNTPDNPGHQYFVDGTPTTYILDQNRDKIIGAGDKVIILFGLRRGGGKDTLDATSRGAYYGLDVTNPAEPKYLGRMTGVEMGETWSQPALARINDAGHHKIVFFVGAGYDNNEDLRFGNTQTFPEGITSSTDTTVTTDDAYKDALGAAKTSSGNGTRANPRGRGIYCFEVARYIPPTMFTPGSWNYGDFGTMIKGITVSDDSGLTYSIPSDLTILDVDFNGFADRIYAGDTGGRIWRFDVGNADKANWTSRLIFKANPDPDDAGYGVAGKGRKMFYRPSVILKPGYISLVFGTGDREHPLNLAVADRLYMVKDSTGVTTTLTEADLMDVSALSQGLTDAQRLALHSASGWYITLPLEGEKVLAPALVFSGVAYFTTYTPSTEAAVIASCTEGNLGRARLWAVSFKDGTAVFAPPPETPADPDDEPVEPDKERVIELGSGIPSGMVPTINEDGSSGGFIGCGAGLCKTPDTVNKLVYPLLWKQW